MNVSPEVALEMIYGCLKDINTDREPELQLPLSPATRLLGSDTVDSLTFVNLIVALETHLAGRLQRPVVLVNEDAFQGNLTPFQDVDSLARYIAQVSAS